MKKLFTILTLCLGVVALNAQIVLLHEGFDEETLSSDWTLIDADGDGYNWMTSMAPGAIVYDGAGCAMSESYNNDVGPLTPDNWLISPAITIPSTATAPTLIFYVAGQDASFAEENYGVYVSTTGTAVADFTSVFQSTSTDTYEQKTVNLSSYIGQTVYIAFRHYNSSDMFRINIDEVEVSYLGPDPLITTSLSAINFGQISLGDSLIQQVSVGGYNLTDGITASVPSGSDFTLSVDNVTFAPDVTLPDTGGTLYIRYLPATYGPDNEQVTITSTNVEDVVVDLTGKCVIFIFREGFDECSIPEGWTIIDADGDENNWEFDFLCESLSETHTGRGMAASASYINHVGPLNPDNWLITPQLTINNNETELSFWIDGQDKNSYAERYGVYVSTTDNTDVSSFTSIFEGTSTENWEEHVLSLADYSGQSIYIAFRHWDITDMYYIKLDDISITTTSEITGIANHTLADSPFIYPNPATDVLNINAEGYDSYQIINLLGQVVSTSVMNNHAQINISRLNDGVYFVRLNGHNGVYTQKFIKK